MCDGVRGGEGKEGIHTQICIHVLTQNESQNNDHSTNERTSCVYDHSPRNELGMTILSHLWSFRSSPELGPAIVRATSWMGVARVNFVTRSPGEG